MAWAQEAFRKRIRNTCGTWPNGLYTTHGDAAFSRDRTFRRVASAEAERAFQNGHALTPREEVPAHLIDAAGLETDRERAIVVGLDRLVRVEHEGRGVPGGAGGEAEDHFDGLLLEGPERALRVALQVEVRIPFERLFADAKLAHVSETPEVRLLAPVARCDEERAVAVEEPHRPDSLTAMEAG